MNIKEIFTKCGNQGVDYYRLSNSGFNRIREFIGEIKCLGVVNITETGYMVEIKVANKLTFLKKLTIWEKLR